MIPSDERRQLITRFGGETRSAPGAVLCCAACLVVLVLIAAGPWVLVTIAPTAEQSGGRVVRVGPAILEGKRVFDERRRVYEERRMQGVPQRALAAELSADE